MSRTPTRILQCLTVVVGFALLPSIASGKHKQKPLSKVVSVAWIAVPITRSYTGATTGNQQAQCYGQGWNYGQWQNIQVNCQTFGSPQHSFSYSTTDVYIYQAIMALDGSRGWIMRCYATPRLGLTGVPLPSRCHWLEPNQTLWAKIGHDKIEVYATKRHADGTPKLGKQGKPKMRWLHFRIITMMDAKEFHQENHGPNTRGPANPNPQH